MQTKLPHFLMASTTTNIPIQLQSSAKQNEYTLTCNGFGSFLKHERKGGRKEASKIASKQARERGEKVWSGQRRNEKRWQVAQATTNDKLTFCRSGEEYNQLREPQPWILSKEKLVELNTEYE